MKKKQLIPMFISLATMNFLGGIVGFADPQSLDQKDGQAAITFTGTPVRGELIFQAVPSFHFGTASLKATGDYQFTNVNGVNEDDTGAIVDPVGKIIVKDTRSRRIGYRVTAKATPLISTTDSTKELPWQVFTMTTGNDRGMIGATTDVKNVEGLVVSGTGDGAAGGTYENPAKATLSVSGATIAKAESFKGVINYILYDDASITSP